MGILIAPIEASFSIKQRKGLGFANGHHPSQRSEARGGLENWSGRRTEGNQPSLHTRAKHTVAMAMLLKSSSSIVGARPSQARPQVACAASRTTWLPNVNPPSYLDGSMAGDFGAMSRLGAGDREAQGAGLGAAVCDSGVPLYMQASIPWVSALIQPASSGEWQDTAAVDQLGRGATMPGIHSSVLCSVHHGQGSPIGTSVRCASLKSSASPHCV